MEKLNELVEQAKEMTVLHGPVWSSALCESGCDGKAIKHHAIISDSKNDFVIDTGSDTNEASWLCDYLELCSPENILAIAEAFRAMEHDLKDANVCVEAAKQEIADLEAKLAELAKQEESRWNTHDGIARPIGLDKDDLVYLRMKRQEIKIPYPAGMVNWKHDGGEFDVIAWASAYSSPRPAPAADLMPGEWTNEQCLEFLLIAFRHAEISGDIEMNDIRLAVKMVNAAAPEVE